MMIVECDTIKAEEKPGQLGMCRALWFKNITGPPWTWKKVRGIESSWHGIIRGNLSRSNRKWMLSVAAPTMCHDGDAHGTRAVFEISNLATKATNKKTHPHSRFSQQLATELHPISRICLNWRDCHSLKEQFLGRWKKYTPACLG